MLKNLAVAALGLAFTVAFPAVGQAETVLEKVARTGYHKYPFRSLKVFLNDLV